MEETRRTGAVALTMATGRPQIFIPRGVSVPWWSAFGHPEPASLYDTAPLLQTLERLVDFERLNRGAPRFTATAVDLETGEDVAFDTSQRRVEADHLRASCALLPMFPPVPLEGRLLGDAGISANLPLDPVLRESDGRPLLCIALDLLPLHAPPPRTLGETAARVQDLLFATQSRRSIAAWQALYDERGRHGASPSITLLHLAYGDQEREVSGKAFDFSPRSAAARWDAGYSDMSCALDDLAAGQVIAGTPGMSVYSGGGRETRLQPVNWSLRPQTT